MIALAFLRPFLPYLLGAATFLAVVGGAYLKGRGEVKAEWAEAVRLENIAALKKQLDTDEAVKTADAARADKAEAELKTFKEKAQANEKALKNPTRECFDADDTRRVQGLFR